MNRIHAIHLILLRTGNMSVIGRDVQKYISWHLFDDNAKSYIFAILNQNNSLYLFVSE